MGPELIEALSPTTGGLWDVILFEIGKFLTRFSLLTSAFFEYKSCINFPKLDENFHWYFLVFLIKNLIVYTGVKRLECVDNKYFSGAFLVLMTLLYSYLKPSMSQVGYDFNTWSFVYMFLLIWYVVTNNVNRTEFCCVSGATIVAFFLEENLTGIQFALDCFISFLAVRFSTQKLLSKFTGPPYVLFFLFTFYVENFCFNVWGLGALFNVLFFSMIYVYMTKGNRYYNILPIAVLCAIIYTYINHYKDNCLPTRLMKFRPGKLKEPKPKDEKKLAEAIQKAIDRVSQRFKPTTEPFVKMNLQPPIGDE